MSSEDNPQFAVGEIIEVYGRDGSEGLACIVEREWLDVEFGAPDDQPTWIYRLNGREFWHYEVDLRKVSVLEQIAFNAHE